MKALEDLKFNATRRHFLSAASLGVGSVALGALLDPARLFGGPAQTPAGALPRALPSGPILPATHLVPRARRVIYLFQSGGPSQLDLFDEKPLLRSMNGEELPESVRKGQRLTGMTAHQKQFPLAGSHFAFARHGQSGAMVSELMPHTAAIADKLCFVKSMHTEAINHDPAVTFVQTGTQQAGRPSIGSWLSYGLGSDNANLPGVHRAALARPPGRPAALLPPVGQRLPAVAAPGRAVPQRQGPGAVPRRPGRSQRRDASPHARHVPGPRARNSTPGCSTPRSTRASRSTRWRTACRRRCPR